jgi:hypothetical protein
MTTPHASLTARPSRVQQLYGYAVCLIAIITLLIATSGFVDALFERGDPLRSGSRQFGYPEPSLTSFEAYRATQQREAAAAAAVAPGAAPAPLPRDTLTTAELRARYDALRADRIARVSYEATQRLVRNGLLILLAAGLFAVHWRWLRSLPAHGTA